MLYIVQYFSSQPKVRLLWSTFSIVAFLYSSLGNTFHTTGVIVLTTWLFNQRRKKYSVNNANRKKRCLHSIDTNVYID
ncbi:hypothetical protein BY458DRAFT_508051, partial [Sporodiniella umbellata]